MMNRREFSRKLFAGGAASLASSRLPRDLESFVPLAQERAPDQNCDLLIKGGTVIDPGQQLHAPMDVAVKDGKIFEISRNFPEDRAAQVVSASGMIVTPGFIDLHVHCHDGVADCVNADNYCLSRGVTTAVDCGSSGYPAIANLHKYIINTSVTRIKALVNVSPLGAMAPGGSLDVLDLVEPKLAAKAAVDHMAAVVGIKVRLSDRIQGAHDLEYLKRAVQAAEASHLPLTAHIDDQYSPLEILLPLLRKGDVYTHFMHGNKHGILDSTGKVLPVVLEARNRGVIFDVAQGHSHLSFEVAEKCLEQNFLPDTLSTDLTTVNAASRVYDLPTMVSKFMALGIKLDEVIQMVTFRPARVFDYGSQLGTLRPGNEADIGIFELREGKFEFEDSNGKKRSGGQKLVSKRVLRRGQLFVNEV